MAPKPHVLLDTKRQAEPAVSFKFNYGWDEDASTTEEPKNYEPMALDFQRYLEQFKADRDTRIRQRDQTISVEHIDFISIVFQSQFNIKEFYQRWFKKFGLLGVRFSSFNHEVLFAISDKDLFENYISDVEAFVETELRKRSTKYSNDIKYVKEFHLLTASDIQNSVAQARLVNLNLANFPVTTARERAMLASLKLFLENNGVQHRQNDTSYVLEIYDASQAILTSIGRNFDVVISMTSALATVVEPGEFGEVTRTYGFSIPNANDDLPVIGILDTGISNTTPLRDILINDNTFILAGNNAFVDNCASGRGHGTGVAALAALGRTPYAQGYRGNVKADAKLLSMKILDASSGYISEKDVIDLLVRAKQKYPHIKIFVLTTCYGRHKLTNEDYSTYSYELDKFAHENDCLLIICTANNDDAGVENTAYDLAYFSNEHTNLCAPAESMNTLIVGSAAGSLRAGDFCGISDSDSHPTLFSRKGHLDLPLLFSSKKINKQYFRPDVLEWGGDYELIDGRIGIGEKASIEVLSALPNESFYSHIGTSFSAPLVANLAARIQKQYPRISSQSIKALIVNSASGRKLKLHADHEALRTRLTGYGLVDHERSVFSDENRVTVLIEEEIELGTLTVIPLNFPEYLSKQDLGKKNGIVGLSITLCYSFRPILNHQLGYCPLHIAFGMFKNHTSEQIQGTQEGVNSKLKGSAMWSQNARNVSKPIPFSNTHKWFLPVNVDDLINEDNTFKLGVICGLSQQILQNATDAYQGKHKYSIVITIEETLKEDYLTGQLYDEFSAVNFLVPDMDADSLQDQEGTLE